MLLKEVVPPSLSIFVGLPLKHVKQIKSVQVTRKSLELAACYERTCGIVRIGDNLTGTTSYFLNIVTIKS